MNKIFTLTIYILFSAPVIGQSYMSELGASKKWDFSTASERSKEAERGTALLNHSFFSLSSRSRPPVKARVWPCVCGGGCCARSCSLTPVAAQTHCTPAPPPTLLALSLSLALLSGSLPLALLPVWVLSTGASRGPNGSKVPAPARPPSLPQQSPPDWVVTAAWTRVPPLLLLLQPPPPPHLLLLPPRRGRPRTRHSFSGQI